MKVAWGKPSMKVTVCLSAVVGLLLLLLSSSPAYGSNDNDNNDDDDNNTCGLYLAVSSTSTAEEPKWGLYAGKEIAKGYPVGFGDIAIQTFHLLANALTDDEEDDDNLADVVEFFEQFIWVPHSSGGQFDLDDGGRIVTAIGGGGVLGGYNAQLTNADWNHTIAYNRPSWNEQPGVAHPGRGAYTNYYDVTMTATQKIPAGMEIFVNYGDNWEDDKDGAAELTRDDHAKVDETIDKMMEFFEKHKDDLDEDSKAEIYQFLVEDVLKAAAGAKKGAVISSMMPESPDLLPEIKASGGSLGLSSPTAVRKIKWLEQYGRCMDNIRPGPSTVPSAGRGAFANRPIKAGSMVSPLPLIQITDEQALNMYKVKKDLDENNEEYFLRESSSSEPVGLQLLVNYCFGHPNSNLLFFPAGAVASLINHSPEPNAKLVWSDHPNNHKHWFDLNPESLISDENNHLGLLMEIVATKDIAEGEEVFIDYGTEWASAWEQHQKDWDELVQAGSLPSPWPKMALDMNQEHKSAPFTNTFPENVMMKCFLVVKKPDNEPPTNEDGDKVRIWAHSDKGSTIHSDNLFDCSIMDSEESSADGWLYTVMWEGENSNTIVKQVPHEAIVFLDKPGTSDQHVEQAFRHYIGIPDDVFPQGVWRNIE